ncbi:hypothetical protein [Limnobacter sp.]|uniref:hypothetical protein n=1 Tax=Limnobacter sp. TaxID=2003368 RepID=UPI003514C8D9
MKLDYKANTALLLNEASRLMGLGPVIVMMGAVLMTIVAVFSLTDLVRASQETAKSAELPEFVLIKRPVGRAVYEEYATVLSRLSPHVSVGFEKDGLRVQINDANYYADFIYVLNSIQGVAQDVVWQAEEICLATCSGAASTALVKGVVEKVEVKLRGHANE